MTTISSVAELEKAIEDAARRTMEDSAKEILGAFKKDYIDKYVYVGTPKAYKRTGEFKESWDFSEIRRLANVLEMELFHSPMRMVTSSPAPDWIHSSYSPPGQDSRLFLHKILNYDGGNMSSGGRVSKHPMSKMQGKPYWDIFIREMLDSGKLKKIIDKHARKNGLNPAGMSVS